MFEDENRADSSGETNELIQHFEEALNENRQPFFEHEGYEQIIDFYEDLHESQKALVAVENAIQQYPFSGIFYIRKAQLFIDMRRFKEAEELLEKAALLDPEEISLFLTQADLLVWKGLHHEAIKLLRGVIEKCDDDEKEDLYLELADIYEDCERYDKVIQCLKKALEYNPKSDEALNRLWFCTELAENYEDMIPFYQSLLDNDPYSVLVWFNLAHAYAGLEMWEKAIEGFEFALAVDDKFEDAYIDCADVYFAVKQYRKAIDLYKEALKFRKPGKDVYFQIGQCYEKLKDMNRARKYYRKATSEDPEFDEAFFRIGETYRFEKRFNEAVSSMERANKLYPDNVFYIKGLAQVYLLMGQESKALDTYHKILEIDGTRRWQWVELARALMHIDRVEEALAVLDEALPKFRKKAELLYSRSAILYRLGRRKEALTDLESALAIQYKRHSLIFVMNRQMQQDNDVLILIELYKP